MSARLTEIVVDCAEPERLARFWAAALGYEIVEETEEFVEIASEATTDAERIDAVRSGPVTPTLLFARVPEGKAAKNRLHLDVNPIDTTQEEEIARLEALGARRTDLTPKGVSWVVLVDPEGNEFCVLRSLAPTPRNRA